MRRGPTALLLAAWLAAPWVAPRALARDGALEWRTIDTPHFHVHFPRGLEAVATRAARWCEEAHTQLAPLFDHAPDRRVHVVVSDFGDSANGSATALPYPRINLFAAPPVLDGNLGDYDDWLRLLTYHEYIHILQLDPVSGLPALFNHLLGRVFSPNQNLPSFVLEGGAVWGESLTSGRGRVRSALFRGFLRAAALEDRLHDLDAVTHAPLDWPGANVWYIYGGHFFDWLARTRGPGSAASVHAAMSDEVVPFSLNRSALEAIGESFTDLFRAWRAELTAQARAERDAISAAGVTPLRRITRTGLRNENPRWTPDGDLLSLESTGRKAVGIYRRRLDAEAKPVPHADIVTASRFDLCPDGSTLYDHVEPHQGAYGRTDLHRLDPDSGRTRRLTRGARLREPACSPDTRWAAAAQIIAGRTRLVSVPLDPDGPDAGRPTVLYDPGGLNQVGFPVIHPDNRTVVFTRIVDGHRGLAAVDRVTGRLTAVTQGDDLPLHPRFTRDGDWLLYSSDQSGVYELYARAWPSGPTRRLTRTVTGALDPAPSPDGRQVAYRVVTADGFDLAVAAFDPAQALPTPAAADAPHTGRADASAQPLPDRPYAPSETLWPVSWNPTFSFSNAQESASQLGLEVASADATGLHHIQGNIVTAPTEDGISAGLNYTLARFTPVWNVSLAHAPRTRDGAALHGSVRQPFRERVSNFATSVGLPFSRSRRRASVSLRYAFTAISPAENPEPPHDPYDLAPARPEAQNNGNLTLSLRYGDADAFPFAISNERGRNFGASIRARHPTLGGELRTAEVFFDYSEFVSLWWRHVLALRVSGAFGRGEAGGRNFFGLGPPPERNVFLDALDEIYFGSTFLRGYPAGVQNGDRYVLLTAEYRLPIFDLFAGPSSAPAFFRRMKLSVFTDWGQAALEPMRATPDAFSRSVGAELVTEATLGWRLPLSARTGLARGLDDGGETQIYFYLGSWF